MINRKRSLRVLLGTSLAAFLVLAGVATHPLNAQDRLIQTDRISRDAAAGAARRATGGRVVSVRLAGRGGRVYLVKVILENERVRTLRVDASSGEILD